MLISIDHGGEGSRMSGSSSGVLDSVRYQCCTVIFTQSVLSWIRLCFRKGAKPVGPQYTEERPVRSNLRQELGDLWRPQFSAVCSR